jgi:hypothetical protein
VVSDLGPLHYRTLAFDAWTPTQPDSYVFEAIVQPLPADDDAGNDRLRLDVQVVDDRVDLWSRDNPFDDGREPSLGLVWQSPDLWVRNRADGLTGHQDPINHTTNTVYARLRNRGTITAAEATVTVYWHPPSLVIGQSWWRPIGVVTVSQVAPGTVRTVSMPWRPEIEGVLTETYHTCLIHIIHSSQDPSPILWSPRASNNIVQRNVDVIPQTGSTAQAASTVVSSTFHVGNPYPGEQLVEVTVDAASMPAGSEVRLDLDRLFSRWQRLKRDSLSGATIVPGTTQIAIPGGGEAVIGGLPLQGEEMVAVAMHVSGLDGQEGKIDVSEYVDGEPLGGLSVHVLGRHEAFLPIILRNVR